MDKIKKHFVSFFVFTLNLILVGIGFLFIKSRDEAKMQQLINNNADVASPDAGISSTGANSLSSDLPASPNEKTAGNPTPAVQSHESQPSSSAPSVVTNNSQNNVSSASKLSPSSPSKKSSGKTKTS
ncbi:MAG: hypothetical protein P4L62_01910 [Candidatus Pacebacteria bacterium]|nr:hypothetical protein [Candidatus Paceibacterota bacterium]